MYSVDDIEKRRYKVTLNALRRAFKDYGFELNRKIADINNELKKYYIEHLGMMLDQAYAIKNIEKIEKYEANGIWPGESLLLTMEGGEKSLNSRVVEAMIDKFLI